MCSGRQETAGDQAVIDKILRDFRESGFRFKELVLSMVTSKLFLQRG